mgnify:CR=1 FL=1
MRCLILATVAAVSLVGAANAQPSPHAAPTKSASSAFGSNRTPSTAAPRTDKGAVSKTCSDEANAKGLHGKEREKFRRACKNGKR